MGATIYISDAEIQMILKRYSLDTASVDSALTLDQLNLLIEEAVGEFETKMCSRYVVPLTTVNGSYELAPQASRAKAKIAVKAMIKVVLARDFGVNSEYGENGEIMKMHQATFSGHLKDFLDVKKVYGFKLQEFAGEASQPVQTIGLARGNNEFESV